MSGSSTDSSVASGVVLYRGLSIFVPDGRCVALHWKNRMENQQFSLGPPGSGVCASKVCAKKNDVFSNTFMGKAYFLFPAFLCGCFYRQYCSGHFLSGVLSAGIGTGKLCADSFGFLGVLGVFRTDSILLDSRGWRGWSMGVGTSASGNGSYL